MYVTAIIVAGGRGQRVGSALPKQLLTVGGRAILERTVEAFLTHPEIAEVVVAVPADLLANPPGYLTAASKPLRIVAGGARRQDSVVNAFRAASARSDVIVVHDGARPFASAELISRTIAAAVESGAALAALSVRDTVKRSVNDPAGRLRQRDGAPAEDSASANGGHNQSQRDRSGDRGDLVVAETLPREAIVLAQTPQAFRRDILGDALASGEDATDEAALVERAGHTVRIVEGEQSNIKITTPEDLMFAEAIAEARDTAIAEARNAAIAEARDTAIAEAPNTAIAEARHVAAAVKPARTSRAGLGYDLHRLVQGRPLILGGVTIPFDRGLEGHSDADAICHAITDAILGAAATGDIGRHFPDTDGRWKNASSVDLLRRAAGLLHDQGLEVGNVDATVILERPKLAPYIDQMREKIADALGLSADCVSIKGKTNEGVGELGRGEAIAVHAIALLKIRT